MIQLSCEEVSIGRAALLLLHIFARTWLRRWRVERVVGIAGGNIHPGIPIYKLKKRWVRLYMYNIQLDILSKSWVISGANFAP